MTACELESVAGEWELALSVAASALAASGRAFAAAELHARRLALARERRQTAYSLAGLARSLHLRLS